jgi:septin family protein
MINHLNTDSKTHQKINIMCVGPAGVGKTSFIEIFMKKFNFNMASKDLNFSGNPISPLQKETRRPEEEE